MNLFLSSIDQWLGLTVEPQKLVFSQMALRAVVIFVAALVMLRLAHKRFFARRNAIDVLLTFVLASTLARAINGSAAFVPTIGVGFLLVFLHRALSFVGSHWEWFGRVTKGSPTTVIEAGQIRSDALGAHALNQRELEEDLRIKGVADPDRVESAVLERNGEVSVIKRPRVHTIKVEGGVQTVRVEVG